eukprot:2445394-Alexandrium_andersonii.AAC.1
MGARAGLCLRRRLGAIARLEVRLRAPRRPLITSSGARLGSAVLLTPWRAPRSGRRPHGRGDGGGDPCLPGGARVDPAHRL